MKNRYTVAEVALLQRIGSRIRIVRSHKNLSQEKLAFECGLDRTYIGSVERGERNISIINLEKIAKALDVSSAQLLSFQNESGI